MKDGKITKEDLMLSLNDCLGYCRPDEFQSRHNLLTRQLTAFLLEDALNDCEENDE